MPSIHETAYPRLKASVTVRDLAEIYNSHDRRSGPGDFPDPE